MGMFRCQVFFINSYEGILFFFSIKVLDQTGFNEIIKIYLVFFKTFDKLSCYAMYTILENY